MLFMCQPLRKMHKFEKAPLNKPPSKNSFLHLSPQGLILRLMVQHLCAVCTCSSFLGPSEAAAHPQVINTREKFFLPFNFSYSL